MRLVRRCEWFDWQHTMPQRTLQAIKRCEPQNISVTGLQNRATLHFTTSLIRAAVTGAARERFLGGIS
jgi:hypothetical protein